MTYVNIKRGFDLVLAPHSARRSHAHPDGLEQA